MSVPVPQRTQGELEVNTRARILCVYTFKILENEKWFPKSQIAFITKLQDCVVEIQALCWEANNIKVDKSAERYQRRIDLQDQAAEKCNRMMMLIETFIKENLRVKFYIRYMDDLILIHEDRGYLERCQAAIVAELTKLGFEINPKKTRIYNLEEGIMFLGFKFSLTGTGKVLMFADAGKIKTAKKKYRRLVAKSKRGEIPKDSVDASWKTWIDHIGKGNSYHLVKRMEAYYKSLWEDNKHDAHPGERTDCG